MQDLPFAHGAPPLAARLRVAPEDFVVEERLGFEADGEGEHVLLQVRKRGANTEWVARELACFADVAPAAVGFAGLKDRHAVTTQTFSVQLAGRADPDWARLSIDGVEVLSARRHRRKLQRGRLRSNRFKLVLRELRGSSDAAESRLRAIASAGVPNYFGEQRFGIGGHNLARARAMFEGRRVDRQMRSLLLSAARAHLFNAVLAERVADGSWNRPLDGELWSLAGSRAWFGPEPWTDVLKARLERGDIHPSGPLWGMGEVPSAGVVAALERRVAERESTLAAGLERAGLRQERRPLRLMAQDFAWTWQEDRSLALSFELPAGAYATTLVRELAACS